MLVGSYFFLNKCQTTPELYQESTGALLISIDIVRINDFTEFESIANKGNTNATVNCFCCVSSANAQWRPSIF